MNQIRKLTVPSVNTCESRRPYRISRRTSDPDAFNSGVTCAHTVLPRIIIKEQEKKMRRNRIFHQFLSSLIALVMIFSLLLPGSVFAANQQPDSEKAIENGEKTLLTGIIITGLEAPEIGKPLAEHADVESVEGVRWEIPVFWMDEDGNELSGTAETEECFPILAFVLPPEYTMAEDDVIAISDEVLTLFRGKTFYTVYDAETGIIYILISLARPGLLVMDMGQAEPQEMIPLPENILIPGDGEETAPTIESGSEKEQGPGEEPEREQGSEKESGTDENPERAETVEPERVQGDGEETGPTKESGSEKEQEPGRNRNASRDPRRSRGRTKIPNGWKRLSLNRRKRRSLYEWIWFRCTAPKRRRKAFRRRILPGLLTLYATRSSLRR